MLANIWEMLKAYEAKHLDSHVAGRVEFRSLNQRIGEGVLVKLLFGALRGCNRKRHKTATPLYQPRVFLAS